MQYIFQDPYSSLNPRLPIITAIGEPMLEHGLADKTNVRDRVTDVLRLCGMDADALDRYPHEFSGGQRQRIGIARAMGLKPDFVVADEPVASLDVSVQAQIINLFSDLQEQRGTTFMFISHDLSVVEHLCSRLMIMYLGVIVEVGSRKSRGDLLQSDTPLYEGAFGCDSCSESEGEACSAEVGFRTLCGSKIVCA